MGAVPDTVANCAESMLGVVSVGLATVVANVEAPVIVPEPLIVIAIFVPYKIIQTEPDGTVTVMPLLIVRGPALMAFLLVVMV